MWIRVGTDAWAVGGVGVAAHIEACRLDLDQWSKSVFRKDKERVRTLESRLRRLLAGSISHEVQEDIAHVRSELERIAIFEETTWRQRSKELWLREGDRNTGFFHRKASQRFKTNLVRKIKDAHGRWVESEAEIQRCIVDHFRAVYASSRPLQENIAKGMECLNSVVDADMEEELLQPYTAIEVSKALFQMAPQKSPGPDGMSPIFFQKFWHIVGNDVTNCVLHLLNSYYMPPGLNSTHIVLIPKCKHPEFLSQFRPISLCNVVYRIASKVIANRLKHLLDRIISPAQSAFVPGRLITDNILIAFELNHFLNSKTTVMSKLGFPPPFVRLVMLCVSSVSYSFLLGGKCFGSLIPERGLRQGDPLSPYLFLLCTESFSSLLQQAEQVGHLRGVKVCRGAPSISHLLFADDTLIFCQASPGCSQIIKTVLETYRKASGQEINFSKSSVAFSKNTVGDLRQFILDDLTIRMENKMELYLGLPSRIARSKRDLFAIIRDQVWARINGWNAKLLSQAGKEVLIKSVIQAIPTYAMGCFRLPVTLLREIQGMIAKFWWGNRGSHKIHWLAWHRLCDSKLEGGLGFRRLELFNLAMLAKQLWRVLSQPDKLLSRVLKAKYFPNGDVFSATLGPRPSYTWRSVMAAQTLFRAGCHWRVGSGLQIRVWSDPWLPRPCLFRPITPGPALAGSMHVADLIDPSCGDWDAEKIRALFWPVDSELILSIPLGRLVVPDIWVWHYSRNGWFSVRSAYHLACSIADRPETSSRNLADHQWWRKLWQLKLPNKIKVWSLSTFSSCLSSSISLDPCIWLHTVASQLDNKDFGLVLCLCWSIWWCRNRKLMEGTCFEPAQVLSFAVNYLEAYFVQSVSSENITRHKPPSHWLAPPLLFVKLNFDGATLDGGASLGAGVVARDASSRCLAWSGEGEFRRRWQQERRSF
ncbi:UNVERIFIED_CONTAM: putative mitochondrial protein [Sesamum latifolium]|uniref:Mitochondrial protein n=1 Tax=Sesamum latifolium TaxID=2727402 RepID=A0AAW2TUJ4_9LAMI